MIQENFYTWKQVIHGQKTDPGSESFLEPGLVPPGNRHQVAKPLVGNLVAYKDGNILPPKISFSSWLLKFTK